MNDLILTILMLTLVICVGMLVLRFILGPTVFDRLTVLESFAPALLCLFAVWGVMLKTLWFFDVILVLSLVGFLSTVAAVKYVEQGNVGDE